MRLLHGLIKGGIKNMIDLLHFRLPKEDLVTDGSNKPRQPELSNMCKAFSYAMEKHDMGLDEDDISKNTPGTARTLVKAKEVGMTALGSDSAYYLMMEYFLKEYVHIKMDHAFGREAVEKAWDDQWQSQFDLLMKNKNEVLK